MQNDDNLSIFCIQVYHIDSKYFDWVSVEIKLFSYPSHA